MALKIVLEGDLALCAVELAAIVDMEQKSGSETCDKTKTALENENFDEIRAVAFTAAASLLTKFNVMAFEPSFNMILQVVSLLDKDNQAALDKDLLTVLEKGLTTKETKVPASAVIAAATNLFNMLSEDSVGRYTTLDLVADLVLETFPASIGSIANNLKAWLGPIKDLSVEQKSQLVTKVFQQLFEQNEAEAYEFALDFAKEDVLMDAVVVTLLNSKTHFSVSEFKIADEKLASLAAVYESLDYTKFKQNGCAVEGVDAEAFGQKLRTLSLVDLFAKSNESVFTYKSLAEAAAVDEKDVEAVVFPLISQGIVSGKFSQLTNTFTVSKVSPLVASRTEVQWDQLDAQLGQWLENLNVLDAQVTELATNLHKKKKVPAVIQRFHLAKQGAKKEVAVEES